MFKFFESISGLVLTLIDYFMFGIMALGQLFAFAVDAVIFVISLIGYLPPLLTAFVVSLIMISVLYLFMNKGA